MNTAQLTTLRQSGIILRGSGVTSFSVYMALLVLGENAKSAVAPSFVAREIGFTTAQLTETCDTLVKLGLADRHDDPDDRRFRLIQLTPKGSELLNLITTPQ